MSGMKEKKKSLGWEWEDKSTKRYIDTDKHLPPAGHPQKKPTKKIKWTVSPFHPTHTVNVREKKHSTMTANASQSTSSTPLEVIGKSVPCWWLLMVASWGRGSGAGKNGLIDSVNTFDTRNISVFVWINIIIEFLTNCWCGTKARWTGGASMELFFASTGYERIG